MVNELQKRLALLQNLSMNLTDEVYAHLAEKGFDSVYGARPLRRAILNMLEDPISESILKGEYTDGDTIDVYMEDGEIKFKKAPKAEAITTEEISK